MLLLLSVALAASVDSCVISREFTVRTPSGHTIAAILETRRPDVRQPAVVLISGAGPHTRDYSTAGSNDKGNHAFAELSRQLAQAGFAVIRFDERGTGMSSGSYERTATTASLASDVEAIVSALSRRAEIDSTRIALVGHSEGGAIASLVAANQPRVNAVVSLAAPSWNGRRIMDWQDAYELRYGSWSSFRPTEESRRAWLVAERTRRETTESWFPYFLDYEPLPAIRRVRVPLLVIHGERDVQVTPEQALELARAAREAGNAAVTIEVLTEHSHALVDPAAPTFPAPMSALVGKRIREWLGVTFSHRPNLRACGVLRGST